MTGTNDAAVISGTSVGAISESNAVQTVSGSLSVSDADAGQSSFVARTGVSGNNGYGSFTINASGAWSYTMSTAHNEFVAGQLYTDSITVSSYDGSANQVITVTMTGTNDAAVISGTSVGAISESNTVQTVSGSLSVSDADAGQSSFVARTGVAGNNGYGSFTINASGAWSYTMSTAHNEFVAGQTYTDSITVSSYDGSANQVITVTMTGTNDAAVISGTSVGAISESNAVQTVSGSLSVSDADAGQSSFVARTGVAGNNGYGSFTINASGAWSYTMSTAHNEFVAGQTYTDSITVSSYDGSANQVITVTMTGTNDAAVISGTSVGAISESDAVQSVSGSLSVSDADAGQSSFVARTGVAGNNGYGSFTINASGAWSYTMSTAHNEFVSGQLYTDSITVSSYDGSANQVITVTMTGTNDAAVISGTSVGAISESDAVQTVSGSLSVSDADAGQSSFVARTGVAGNNGYGSFTINASGAWSYTMSNAHNEFVAGQMYTDSITVSSYDGSANQVITVTMTGTNDAAVISGTSVGAISESNAAQSVSGSLSVSDADAGESLFVAQTAVAGNNGYGSFTINASGAWSYTMNNAHNEFVAGQTYTDSITVSSYDGSANQVITVTITGTNDIPTIGGQNTGSIVQSNEAQSVSGVLSVTDLDAGESYFVPQTGVSGNNNYGLFTIGTNGAWTYTMNSAHTEFAAGIAYTDRITVSSVDGTATQDIIVTMTGINNAPSITNSTDTSQVTTAVGTTDAVYTVTSTDLDANTTFTYSISGGVDASLCNIGSTTGVVTFKANPTVGIYYITVKVADENSAYAEKEITIIVTSETAANHSALTEAVVETIIENSVVVGDVTVSDLTTTASVEVPDGSTLTVANGQYSGTLTGNGALEVTGDVDLTSATLDDYSGAFTVSGTLTIATSAGSIITLTSNNDGTTTVSVKISSTDTTAATTISSDMYASSDGTIENTNTEQPVVFSGTLYKPSTTFTLVGLIEIAGAILGQTPDSDESLEDSDINIGNAIGSIADVVYASTDPDAYLYDGETTVYSGSSLTLNNGANLENSVVTINAGATLILNYIDTPIHVKELIINGNLIINLNSPLSDGYNNDILTTATASSNINNSRVKINHNGSFYIVGYSNADNTSYRISVSTPTSNVCFPAKTPIMTNQGAVNIEDIDPSVHTIRNKKIVAITKTVAHDKNLVRIAKHALGHLYPEKTTFISQNHKVFYQGQMVKAKHLVDEAKGVTFVPYNGQVLYNVLLEEHEKMQVNNLIVETLHPEHKVAKLYRFLQNVDAAHHGKLIALFNQKDREQRLRR
jgi:VCBS repeat-containing protein